MTAKTEKPKETETPKVLKKTPPYTRWVKNAFFDGGVTKYIRLDEIHNFLNDNHFGEGDATDKDIAAEILRRAGLVEHSKYSEILQGLTEFFETIPDPAMEWINPNYGKHYPKPIRPV